MSVRILLLKKKQQLETSKLSNLSNQWV